MCQIPAVKAEVTEGVRDWGFGDFPSVSNKIPIFLAYFSKGMNEK